MSNITTKNLEQFLDNRTIGFGRMLDLLDNSTMNANSSTYPPYNVIQEDENNFIIELALAGFKMDDLNITQDKNKLIIESGDFDPEGEVEDPDTVPKYLHKGISNRKFTREFTLADYVLVDGAEFTDGILAVKLYRNLPDEMKPRTIEISGNVKQIEG